MQNTSTGPGGYLYGDNTTENGSKVYEAAADEKRLLEAVGRIIPGVGNTDLPVVDDFD